MELDILNTSDLITFQQILKYEILSSKWVYPTLTSIGLGDMAASYVVNKAKKKYKNYIDSINYARKVSGKEGVLNIVW